MAYRTNTGAYQISSTALDRPIELLVRRGEIVRCSHPEEATRRIWHFFNSRNQSNGVAVLAEIVDSLRISPTLTTNRAPALPHKVHKECSFPVSAFASGIVHEDHPRNRPPGRTNLFCEISFLGRFSPSRRCEMLIALSLVIPARRRWGARAAAYLLVAFTVALCVARFKGADTCGCTGLEPFARKLLGLDIHLVTLGIIRNLLVLVCLAVYVGRPSFANPPCEQAALYSASE